MVVTSENVKSFNATHAAETKRNFLIVRFTTRKGEGRGRRASLTIPKRAQSLGLFDETIDLVHLVKPGFSPAFMIRLDYFHPHVSVLPVGKVVTTLRLLPLAVSFLSMLVSTDSRLKKN